MGWLDVRHWALADWQRCRPIAATRLSSTVGTRRAPERRDLVESGLTFWGGRTWKNRLSNEHPKCVGFSINGCAGSCSFLVDAKLVGLRRVMPNRT